MRTAFTPSNSLSSHVPVKRQQRGMMLIEVLVSILIFSIGVLALVGLQARMTASQSDAKYRADAGYLANEVVGMMWSDLAHVANYNGTACTSNTRCSDWQSKVSNTLPNGTGAIVIDATTQMVTITVTWQHGSDGQHTYSTRTRLSSAS